MSNPNDEELLNISEDILRSLDEGDWKTDVWTGHCLRSIAASLLVIARNSVRQKIPTQEDTV